MIKWIKKLIAVRKREAQLKICRKEGHFLQKSGEMSPHKMVGGVPVKIGPPDFFIYGCACGYSEINDPGKSSYFRPFEEGLKLIREASIDKSTITGG